MSQPFSCNMSSVILRNKTGDRRADISDQCKHIDIYESILSPVITADLQIQDAIDLLSGFPILGEETIEFSFWTDENKKRKIKLSVYAIEKVSTDQYAKKKFYTLRLVSEELFSSSKAFVYKKFKKEASSIVKDIVNEITSKSLFVEGSKGIEELLVSQLKPFPAIDKIRRRAIHPQYESSSYCFYENRDGFSFRTLEGLLKKGKEDVGDRIFFYDSNVAEDIRTSNYRNIIALQPIRYTETLETIALGGMSNQVTSFDLITGQTISKENKHKDVFEKIDKLAGGFNSSQFKSGFLKEAAQSFLVTADGSKPELEIGEKISKLHLFINDITKNLLWVHVNGDSSISCSDTIECNLPSFDGLTEVNKSRLHSGRYLIAKCRHMITFNINPVYTQSFELIKGSTSSGQSTSKYI